MKRPLSGSDRKMLVGRAILDNPDEAMKKRLEGTRLTDARLTALETLAANIRQAGDAAAAPIAAPTSQADVDYWDGINLYLVDYLIEMFEAGHEACFPSPSSTPAARR